MSAKQVSKLAGEAYSLFVCMISEVISFPAVFVEDMGTLASCRIFRGICEGA